MPPSVDSCTQNNTGITCASTIGCYTAAAATMQCIVRHESKKQTQMLPASLPLSVTQQHQLSSMNSVSQEQVHGRNYYVIFFTAQTEDAQKKPE